VSVVMHNRAVGWWLRHPQPPGVALLHVDSHVDMNPVHAGGGRLRRLGRRVAQGRSPPRALDPLLWDIGGVVTAYLALGGLRDVVWLHPAWVRARPAHRTPVALVRERGRLTYRAERGSGLRAGLRLAALRPQDDQIFRYTQLRARTRGQWERLRSALGERFVLDIDLDYFVTNGVENHGGVYESEARSPLRRRRCRITQAPRQYSASTAEMSRRRRQVHAELRAIDERIRSFASGLRQLQRRGCVPTLVSLSDSAATLGGLTDGISWSNNYTPAHLVMYVKTRLLRRLRRLYGGAEEFLLD